LQSNSEIRLIRSALENLERSVKESGDTAPLTQALLEIFTNAPKRDERREDRKASFDNPPTPAADLLNADVRTEAVLDHLDWIEDAMREVRRRTTRLALMAQEGVKAPPPR
jgi:hypothetical protein